jgi:hypothetical protein
MARGAMIAAARRGLYLWAVPARILLFSLDELRSRYPAPGGAGPGGERSGADEPPGDPRRGAAEFRAFRDRLLAAAARAATGPAALSMWWEGTYNGYCLAVGCTPAVALAALDPSEACAVEDERVAPPRPDGVPLARVVPGCAEVARDADGATWEAPFGAPAGHFGAPGIRRGG